MTDFISALIEEIERRRLSHFRTKLTNFSITKISANFESKKLEEPNLKLIPQLLL